MTFHPQTSNPTSLQMYFADKADKFPGVTGALKSFYANPTLSTAQDVMRLYFSGHTQGNVESLNKIASAFADKRLAVAIVDSIVDDDDALEYIAKRSYPHPIGFDKLVLYHDPETNFKFRLHVYWRGNTRADMERLHLHRFEMASAIISGELTNHTWAVTEFNPNKDNNIVPSMQLGTPAPCAEHQNMHAYTGYWRDAEGILHKKHIGSCTLGRLTSETHVSGESYAQVVEHAHYVETNAETGRSNGDVCSTIYIHSGGLKDDQGRSLPILFEENELDNPDQIIDTIPNMTIDDLRAKLLKYKGFIENQLEFYDWLYDEKHGRNLSTGMIAGYILAEHYNNPHTLSVWIDHEEDAKEILKKASKTVRNLVTGKWNINKISDDDRIKRYYAQLVHKAKTHPQGKEYWLEHYSDLVKEMWRYCGAIKGEKPDVTVLKPIWEDAVGKKLPGGAHYGHVAAMLEAAYVVKGELLQGYKDGVELSFKTKTEVVTELDKATELKIKAILKNYYPNYSFYGEETGDRSPKVPNEGDKRFVVDPIDGTRNLGTDLNDFATSIACEEFQNGQWITTDGVISIPLTNKIYWAEKGQGAYCIDGNDLEHQILKPTPAINNTHTMARAVVNTSIRGFGKAAQMDMMRYITMNDISHRNTGSVAIMLCYSAINDNHVSIITAKEYDIAAGLLIAQEAGANTQRFDFIRDSKPYTALVVTKNMVAFDTLNQQVAKSLKTARVQTLTPR